MAVSPLYPGDPLDPNNPIYPGYYPGQPIQRPPKFIPQRPNEYNFNEIQNFINKLDFEINNVPTWAKEQLIGDVKRGLRIAAHPRGRFSYDVQRAIETGELDEAPGVQLQLNLNPQDWANDPQKELTNTLKSWGRSIFNMEDLERYVTYNQLFVPLIRGNEPNTGIKLVDEIAKDVYNPFQLQSLYDDISKPEYKKYELVPDPTVPGGFSAHDAAPPAGKGKKPLYGEAGSNFVEFTLKADNAGQRKGAYAALMYSTIAAVNEDTNQTMQALENSGKNFFDFSDKKAYFDAKAQIAASMKNVRGSAAIPISLPAVSDHLAKIALEGEGRDVGGRLLGAQRSDPTKSTPGIKIKLLSNNPSESVIDLIYSTEMKNGKLVEKGVVGKALTELYAARESIRPTPPGTRQYRTNGELYTKLTLETQEYEKYLLGLKDIAEKARAEAQRAIAANNPAQIKNLANSLKAQLELKRNEFTTDLRGGIEDKFLYNFVHNELYGQSGPIPELFKVHGLGDELKGHKSMGNVLTTSKRMYDINEAQDFASAINDGKILQYLVWDTVKTRLGVNSPGQLVGRALKDVHAFGLIYDEDTHDRLIRQNGIDLFENLVPKHSFSISVGGNSYKFAAGHQFDGAMLLQKQMLGKDFGEFVLDKEFGYVTKDIANLARMDGVIKVLNQDYAGLHLTAINDKYILGDIIKIQKFKNEVLRIRFPHLFDANGNFINTDANKKMLLEIMSELHRIEINQDLLSITAERIGLFTYLSAWANQVQTTIAKSLKKYLGPVFVLRKALTEALSRAISKLITGALASVTAGVGIIGAGLIDKATEYITKYIVGTISNLVEKFASALIKMDFRDVYKEVGKVSNSLGKILLIGCSIPLFIMIFVVYTFSTIAGGSSNFNPSRIDGGVVTGDTLEGGADDEAPPPHSPERCPLVDGPNITTGSLNGNSGHGSRSYWSYGDACNYTIPYLADPSGGATSVCPNNSSTAACGPTSGVSNLDNLNPCYVDSVSPLQTYYGFAIDVVSGNDTVYLPKIGTVETWTVGRRVSIFDGTWGYGVIITGTDTTIDPDSPTGRINTYKLYLGHLNNFWLDTGNTGAPGDPLAKLFVGPNFGSHVHIEVTRNDVPMKPETLGICR